MMQKIRGISFASFLHIFRTVSYSIWKGKVVSIDKIIENVYNMLIDVVKQLFVKIEN